ncbi:hypothetical protein MAMC_00480 [Methylacidimicrobium cyclopophantes]|uniref:VWFA domain-containing protein n=1 Tax=Methylacidimicrobium cyclopophantes TaxID=1041766 RepID=A0A5E6MA73_9BACT|nr:vWA domain-containing protein [Methylacidimicrobium cyclopophantes]VVM05248.1 hypothetical protein MAMC_00480 [Methylacidimicrobium cyclopophantes]
MGWYLAALLGPMALWLGLWRQSRARAAAWTSHTGLALYREALLVLPRRCRARWMLEDLLPLLFLFAAWAAFLSAAWRIGARRELAPASDWQRRLVLVDDLSGSMQGKKEESLRRANLRFLAASRVPEGRRIRFGLIEFSGSAAVRLPLVPLGRSGDEGELRDRLERIVQSVSTKDPGMGMGTELGMGIWAGLEAIVRSGRWEDAALLRRWRAEREALERGSAMSDERALRESFGDHADAAIVAFTDGMVRNESLPAARVLELARALHVRTYCLSVEDLPAEVAANAYRTMTRIDPENEESFQGLYEEIARKETRPRLEWKVAERSPWEGPFFGFACGALVGFAWFRNRAIARGP